MNRTQIAVIDETTKIEIEEQWDSYDIMHLCIENHYYTHGTSEAYDKMLHMVATCKPTPRNIYLVSKDILEHSDPELILDPGIDGIMYEVSNTIYRYYTVKER